MISIASCIASIETAEKKLHKELYSADADAALTPTGKKERDKVMSALRRLKDKTASITKYQRRGASK